MNYLVLFFSIFLPPFSLEGRKREVTITLSYRRAANDLVSESDYKKKNSLNLFF